MNAKNLPLQVGKELKEIADYIQNEINQSGLLFESKSNKDFGFKIYYRNDKKIYFEISQYKVVNESVQYTVVQIPNDLYNSIDDSFEEEREMDKYEVFNAFRNWIVLVGQYAKLSSIDFANLFQLNQDELFLQNERDTFSEEYKILNYCLKSLSVSNFQGIKRTTIENLPVDTNWVFLVGENGFGKSTILQSIVLGLHGSKDGSKDYVEENTARIKVEYKNDKENIINDFRLNSSPLSHLAAYGPVRLNMQGSSSVSEVSEKSGTLYSLFRTDGVLLNVEFELIKWALKEDIRFSLVKRAFCKLVPNIADVRFNSTNDRIEYIEKDTVEGGELYEPLPFEKIASGFRSILGMAGDMIVRLSNTQKDVEDPSKLKGIVIIDELDLHWHPKLQKQIPELFSEVFPGIQFIVSTHSPIPLLGAPKTSVILKVNRTKEEGITIQKVDIDLTTLTPNLLLTSGIFDMDNIFSAHADMTQVRTEETFDEMEKNDDVEKYLNEFEKSNEQFPDALFEPKTK
jgi:predicted ATPase